MPEPLRAAKAGPRGRPPMTADVERAFAGVEALVMHARQAMILIRLLTSDLLDVNARVAGRSRELDERLAELERASSRRYGLILAIVAETSDPDCAPELIERHVATLESILERTADECEAAWETVGDRLAVAQELLVDERSARE